MIIINGGLYEMVITRNKNFDMEMKTESSFEFQCRLCLRKSPLCYSIFEEHIYDIIEVLTSIKFSEDDELPSTCCSECLEDVYRVAALRTRIIESDQFLRARPLNKLEIPNSSQQTNDVVETNSEDDTKIVILMNHKLEQSTDSDNEFQNYSPEELEQSRLPEGITIDPELTESLRKRIEIKREIIDNSIHDYHCYECNTIIKNRKDFLIHLESHNLVNCHVCGIQLPHLEAKSVSKYIRHMEIHYPQPQVCELCGALARSYDSLRGHMRYEHSGLQFKCDECNITFKRKCRYTLHIQTFHIGARTHICEMCGKGFFTKLAVKKHIEMKHLKLRPYVCEYCKKGFSSRYAKKTHVRQHTNETPFICYVCGDGFRQKVSMKTHIKSKHGIKYEEENPYRYNKNRNMSGNRDT